MDRFAGARVGWKLAATGGGGRVALGVDQPLAGPLYERFQVPVGGGVDFAPVRMRMVEAEFGLQLGRNLPASGAPYDHDTIRDAIAAFVPAIEFPDTRYVDHRSVGATALTADTALRRAFVLGARCQASTLRRCPNILSYYAHPTGQSKALVQRSWATRSRRSAGLPTSSPPTATG